MKDCYKAYSKAYPVQLFYLSVISYLDCINELKAEDICLDKLSPSHKTFLRYYIYKLKSKSNKELKSYIVNKVIPILNEDHNMEAYIFKQELYLMKAKEEILLLDEKMKTLNYVILQNWEEVFLNL